MKKNCEIFPKHFQQEWGKLYKTGAKFVLILIFNQFSTLHPGELTIDHTSANGFKKGVAQVGGKIFLGGQSCVCPPVELPLAITVVPSNLLLFLRETFWLIYTIEPWFRSYFEISVAWQPSWKMVD